ncbi:MAG: phasin family protein [Alphaproteobacteria bacterium]|nr:phasin family protein [Alphaproteobacteria bacterium]
MLQRSKTSRPSWPTYETREAAPRTGTERIEIMAHSKNQAVSKVAEEAAAQAQKVMTDGAAQARVAMEKNMEQMTKGAESIFKAAEEAADFGRGNVEAFTKAAQTWASGSQDLARQYMALAQGLTEHALEGAKALSSVKSVNEAAELQGKFAKAALEKVVAEGTKLQEASVKLAESAFAPVNARFTVAIEKLAKPLAA